VVEVVVRQHDMTKAATGDVANVISDRPSLHQRRAGVDEQHSGDPLHGAHRDIEKR
jgi:hypothetical protein